PSRENAVQFAGFRHQLHRIIDSDPIVIPGNHDQKSMFGMLGINLRQVANLEWSSLVPVDELQMVFMCFDSSKDGDGARGRVTVQQRLEMAEQFDNLMNREPKAKEYLRIVLVHHHPFSFDLEADAWWWRILAQLGYPEERFLRMDDAEEFIKWCGH